MMKKLLMVLVLSLASGLCVAEEHAVQMKAIPLQYAEASGVSLAYRSIGSQENPTILMIMGLGASHLMWGDGLPFELADAGYHVIVFDNRDVGESQRFEDQGDPVIWWEVLKSWLGFEMNAPYDLADMAADTTGLMDALGMDQVHLVGVSMGGMIAQVVAARYPERIKTLTSIMSTPGFGDHLPPAGELGGPLSQAGDETEDERMTRLWGFGFHPEALPRQLMAIVKSGDRQDEVRTISVPTLVQHGVDDTLITVEHGEYTAELIKGARFVRYEGMAHNMPSDVMPVLVGDILNHLKEV